MTFRWFLLFYVRGSDFYTNLARGALMNCIFPFDFISFFHQAAPTCKAEPGKADSVSTGFGKDGLKIVSTLQEDGGRGEREGWPGWPLKCLCLDLLPVTQHNPFISLLNPILQAKNAATLFN